MYLSIYRLHHAKSQMGPMCRIYAMLSKSVICTCFLYRLHHTKQPDGLYICAESMKYLCNMRRVHEVIKKWICNCSYTDYIMRNSQKGCIYMCRVYEILWVVLGVLITMCRWAPKRFIIPGGAMFVSKFVRTAIAAKVESVGGGATSWKGISL